MLGCDHVFADSFEVLELEGALLHPFFDGIVHLGEAELEHFGFSKVILTILIYLLSLDMDMGLQFISPLSLFVQQSFQLFYLPFQLLEVVFLYLASCAKALCALVIQFEALVEAKQILQRLVDLKTSLDPLLVQLLILNLDGSNLLPELIVLHIHYYYLFCVVDLLSLLVHKYETSVLLLLLDSIDLRLEVCKA